MALGSSITETGNTAAQSLRPAAWPPPVLQISYLFCEHGPARGAENDCVPYALQRQDDSAREIKLETCCRGVGDRKDAVNAARGPRDKHRDGEYERGTEVSELDGIKVVQLAHKLVPYPEALLFSLSSLPYV